MKIAVAVVACVILVFVGFRVIGPARVWAVFGPPDLGPVSFERLERRKTGNDGLACPVGLCRARTDAISPVFPIGAAELRQVFTRLIALVPRVSLVAENDRDLTDRYIQRSAVMGFPDTIVVRFLDLPDGRSTLAIYSRSQLGSGDFGVNRARVKAWLAMLQAAEPAGAGLRPHDVKRPVP